MRSRASKRLSKQLDYILGAIGYIFYLTSLIEYNLVQIISAEKYLQVFDKDDIEFIDIIKAKEESNRTLHELTSENKMLGKLISLLEKTSNVDDGLISDLRRVSEIRGYYAHQFFKDDLYVRHLETNPLFYKKMINNDVTLIYKVHRKTLEIDETNRYVANKAKELGL